MVKLEEGWAGPPVCHPRLCSHDTGLCRGWFNCVCVCLLALATKVTESLGAGFERDGLSLSNKAFRLRPGCGL